jgi:predicted CopG family antitoxin
MKVKKSIAIPPEMYEWALKQCKKTGESFSALITRLMVKASGN